MLFMCHQMANEHEKKQKAQTSSRQTSVNDSKVPIIWVLGGPGCGKGTQCDKIVAKYHFNHLSTGDLLRAEVASGSAKGQELQAVMKAGGLVSNDVVLELLAAAIKKIEKPTGFLIDGYPREEAQGRAFEEAISPVDLILYFECTDETLVARIQARAAASTEVRADDNEETLKTRIKTFRENTEKILVQYPAKLKRINAERYIDEIFNDVTAGIDGILASK
ncbi:adenylate kinase isoenzyme 1 isoform X2 [Chironomus tepperi]|uniref:adenylate kinase isoenzyme 1 isoform X2 n=1 Tax=Chironomus tepperi TaxID=113505 RepID=UPI00391EF3B1